MGETYISEELNTIVNIVYTPSEKQFPCRDWLLRGGSDASLVYPMLKSVQIDRCPCLCIPTWNDLSKNLSLLR